MIRKALYYTKIGDEKIQCLLCPHNCKLTEEKIGICGTRKNIGGVLHTLIYGEVTGYGLDPIEKKPLYHFYPGKPILSFGTKGCNLACEFCQNWHISQRPDCSSQTISPQQAVDLALNNNSFAIAYTYSEPVIWYEYLLDTAKLAQQNDLKNVLVTNGYLNEDPLKELIPYVDAANIDLKSFDESFYKKICKGRLDPILRFAEITRKHWHIEVTHLIVPFKAESEILEDIKLIVDWVVEKLGKDTPLHFSRYFPCYKFTLPQTPYSLLKAAREIALKKLDFVYLGNVAADDGNDTLCPNCHALLIKRDGYYTSIHNIKNSTCTRCNHKINILGI